MFLLFVVVLAALGPIDAAVAGPVASAATHEHKPDPKEQRDSEKLRDRLPKPAAPGRRHEVRHANDRSPLPVLLQRSQGSSRLLRARFPNCGNDAYYERRRLRHSPGILQVVRH